MCGFVGVLHFEPQTITNEINEEIIDWAQLLSHRGPDDEGFYTDDYVCLGFKRLSILDIEGGHQPLSYENERYWIVFNGEIYNHAELRRELKDKGFEFATNSDTEVLLALYSVEREKMLQKLRGMFSIAIWDKEKLELFGARDHFGIKPFFYSLDKEAMYFASEKKAILSSVTNEIDRTSLQHYLSFQYVPEANTITEGIHILPPGHYFTIRPGHELAIAAYWRAKFQPISTSDETAAEEIRNVMRDSVQAHLRSDVPVGAFLSGGIDSTFIVSLAKEVVPDIKTFTVGFEKSGYSEISMAEETANALQLDHCSRTISPEEFLSELPKIAWHMDDPLADPAAVPLYFVAREASQHVKAVLSGEGADELFGGYNIYREPHSLRVFSHMPLRLLRALKVLSRILPEGFKGKSFIERGTTPLEERYIGNEKIFEESEKQLLLREYCPENMYTSITEPYYKQSKDYGYDPVTTMQHIDIQTWLRGDILVKADRMTMAHSLELRVPFLDKEVFAVASRLSLPQKVTSKATKRILRKAAEGIVPDSAVNRRKLGFPVPIRHWLKEEMHDWALELIRTSDTDEFLNKNVLTNLLHDHALGKRDYSRKLWTVLMFMLWHQVYMEGMHEFDDLDMKKVR